jgi:hypothetical protein
MDGTQDVVRERGREKRLDPPHLDPERRKILPAGVRVCGI